MIIVNRLLSVVTQFVVKFLQIKPIEIDMKKEQVILITHVDTLCDLPKLDNSLNAPLANTNRSLKRM